MDSEQETGADSAGDTPVAGAGAQLRAAREALRLDLSHIAAETRIPVRHLEAIEGGNFEALPSRAYAIGFSRTYAKAVGLDAAVITDVVRSELADGSMRRATAASGMEPGDPARLPSAGLAWAGAVAALVLAIGTYAFYNSYFGAGTEPGPLLAPVTEATPAARPIPSATAPVTGGEVVLTALEDGVWLRLYEEGGERLIERTLKQARPCWYREKWPIRASTPGGPMLWRLPSEAKRWTSWLIDPQRCRARRFLPLRFWRAVRPSRWPLPQPMSPWQHACPEEPGLPQTARRHQRAP